MPTFTRGGMARGVKLALQNVFTPLQSVASALSTALVGAENCAEKGAPFRVNLHFPQLPFWAFRTPPGLLTNANGVPVPFVLPLPQQYWNGTQPNLSAAPPRMYLEEVQLSFDQGDEGAAPQITPVAAGSVDGRLSQAAALNLTLHLTLLEHSPTVFGNTSLEPDAEVFSVELPALAFQSAFLRANPFVIQSLRKAVSPWKSYVLVLDWPRAYEAAEVDGVYLALPAVTVSLRFVCELMSRDVSLLGFPMQNMPSHLGIPATHAVTITAPAADTTIEAASNDGVATNMAALDAVAQRGVAGSYERDGSLPQYEELDDTAAYEIIAVPMMQNMVEGGAICSTNVGSANNVGAAPYNNALCDRRIIPLAYPITIHHVVAGLNWSMPGRSNAFGGWSALASGAEPNLATQTWACGVGLLSGIRSDLNAVSQVAYRSTDCASWTGTIDRCTYRSTLGPVRLMSVPLVGPVGPTGAGFAAQGFPIWASRGTSRTVTRTNTYDTAGAVVAPPLTGGCEQALEVRMSIQAAGAGLADPGYTWAGHGGHWVFIYGKKHLATTKNQIVR
jgi:hypothetical protein